MKKVTAIRSEDTPAYLPDQRQQEDAIIARALEIIAARMLKPEAVMSSPQAVKDFCILKLAGLEREEFSCLWLTHQHGLIRVETLATGTIDAATVYPREVVKAALACNAAAVILVHNHPSGEPEPSAADRALTERLKNALGQIDIRVLDHIVTGGNRAVSFAERGWI